MAQLSRVGDRNNIAESIMRGSSTVFANGIAVGLHVSPLIPDITVKTTVGSPTVFADGSPVLRVGSGDTGGHRIIQGSPDVFCP